MKKLFFLFIFALISISGFSQTAAYYCSQTGAIGYCYGNNQVLNCAYNNSISYGAISPRLILNTSNNGYGALAIGVNQYGMNVFGISAGYNSLDQAKRVAISQCSSYGGSNVYIKDSWLDN